MDGKPAALHATEPCHLPLGKLMNGYLHTGELLFVSYYTSYVFCLEFILFSLVNKVFGRNSFVE